MSLIEAIYDWTGLRGVALARLLGESRMSIRRYDQGVCPGLGKVEAWARILDVSLVCGPEGWEVRRPS